MAVQAKDTGDKTRAVENTVAQIEKMYGKGSIMRLGDRTPVMDIPVLSTGSIALDAALGVGGVPCGRIIEVF